MGEPRDQNRFLVRMPEGMRDRIADAAKASNRSMNAEIVARLAASFDAAPSDMLNPVVSEMLSVLEQLNTTLATDPKVRREFEAAMRRRG